ncbi:MAG: M23 family peptidase [Proteobacteria bacterium]|nr:M23 family peptidase [Pseudomonadota bacterium]
MGGLLTRVLKYVVFRLAMHSRRALLFVPYIVLHVARAGVLPVKDRHVYTRSGRLRLRYLAMMAVAFLGLAGTNLSVEPNRGIDIAAAEAAITGMPLVVAEAKLAPTPVFETIVVAPPTKPVLAQPASYKRVLKVQSGDTLSTLMQHAAITGDSSEAVKALKGHINPKDLKAGQSVTLHYQWTPEDGERWAAMEFSPSPLTRVVLKQGAGGGFKVDKLEKPLKPETRAVKTKITSSLYTDLNRAGVPDSIIAEFIKVYSYSIDFARDIWAGDSVEILYDVARTDDGAFVKGENILYATLTVRGKPNTIVRFNNNGAFEYFDGKGEPVRKALLRTPVDGARVTSGFGMRRHPIQGYNKMHKGVDFGAPTGTPIFAAGDGVIARAGWFSGYGKYVSIKHNNTYSTAYGHMSQIAVKPGQRVRQGQVIGRVGSTGNSTGPHLHFEVLKGGAQVNPTKVANLSVGNKLVGKQLAKFEAVSLSARQSVQAIVGGAAKPMLVSAEASR